MYITVIYIHYKFSALTRSTSHGLRRHFKTQLRRDALTGHGTV
jgi:hypothetical protein